MKIFLCFSLLVANFLCAQVPQLYTADSIPATLRVNANAVYRLDEAILDVSSPSHYTLRVHQVVTILNAEGADHLRHVLGFDKFYAVDDIEITTYSSSGLPFRKYTKKDFEVRAAYDGISLVTDDRVMRLYTPAPGYPCTIDTRYTIDAKGYIDLPDWSLNNHNKSVETFRYVVTVPSELDIRFRSVNFGLRPLTDSTGAVKKYTWEIKNVKATTYQADGFKMASYMPEVEIAPTVFQYDGYKGSFRDWTDYGKWNYALYEDRAPFNKQRTAEISDMVKNETDVKEKVKTLYDYLKKNVRYVSIQLGIGGFKPFPVKFVDEKKYGDCKALTNYMRHLLQIAGIPSYPALINAGYDSPPVDPAFPTQSFNHVILCVPNQSDTIWLECTSNDNEPGFLGSFTENKNALVLTENGGVLVKTPSSRKERNRMNSHTEIFINEDGSAKSKVQLSSTGDMASMFQAIKRLDQDDQKEIFVRELRYAPADQFALEDVKDIGEDGLKLNLEFDKFYDFKSGSKYFFPQKLNKLYNQQLKDEERKIEYVFEYPFEKTDTTVFILPPTFTIDELPAAKDIHNDFASYKKQVSFDPANGKITVISSLGLKKNIILPSEYKSLLAFHNAVREDEDVKMVLKRKE
jgi:hypothetical protein